MPTSRSMKMLFLASLMIEKKTPRGYLCLILVLDQFPRHIYRNKPEAFATDPQALKLVLEGLEIKASTLLSEASFICPYSTVKTSLFKKNQ